MVTKAEVYYKGTLVPFQLPANWELLAMARPQEAPALPDLPAAVRDRLAHPLGMAPLAEVVRALPHRRTAIISEDQERPTPVARILMPLLAELNALGLADEDIDVVIGRGTHRPASEVEVRAKLGDEALSRLRVSLHDPDATDLVDVGTTSRGTQVRINRRVAEAALVISIGTANVHYFAGYGGGAKIILPGVSSRQTIRQNHVLVRDAKAQAGATHGNPVWEDMLETARLAGLTFAFNSVLNTRNEVAALTGGEVEAQQRAAIALLQELYGVPVPGQADVTIVSGYPLEMSLIQSGKAILTADTVTKPGGTIILVSACADGSGPLMYETLSQRPSPEELVEWIADGRANTTGGTMASRLRKVLQSKKLVVVTDGLSKEQLADMEMVHAPSLPEALDRVADGEPKQVTVLPVGGSVFPILGA